MLPMHLLLLRDLIRLLREAPHMHAPLSALACR
jgi:hypothetical protein